MAFPTLRVEKDIDVIMKAVHITLIIITTTAVALRFLGRRVGGAGFWWDDWMVLAALPFSLGCNILNLICVDMGIFSGETIGLGAIVQYEQLVYASELLYNNAMGIIKWGVLLMYLRIFGINRKFKIAVKVVAAIVGVWWISCAFAVIFQCWPIARLWDKSLPGSCVNYHALFLGQAIPNIVTDLIVTAMPQPLVWKLRLSQKKRIGLCFVFLLGYFTTVSSIIRFVLITRDAIEHGPWDVYQASIWSAVEPAVGIVTACLPCLGPLFRCNLGRKQEISSASGSGSHPRTGATLSQTTRWNTRLGARSNASADDIEQLAPMRTDGAVSLDQDLPVDTLELKSAGTTVPEEKAHWSVHHQCGNET